MGFILSPQSPALAMENQDFPHLGGISQVVGLSVKIQDSHGQSEAVVLERPVCAPWGRSGWDTTFPHIDLSLILSFQLHFSVLPLEVTQPSRSPGGLTDRQKHDLG